MRCENCVKRITKALKEAELNFKLDLSQKTVEIDGDTVAVDKAIAILDDLGFSAAE
jgi:copper chaperone CopZ